MSDTTVSIQVYAGHNKDEERGKGAPLTTAQLTELVRSAGPSDRESRRREEVT